MFPNPTKGRFVAHFSPQQAISEVIVTNLSGQRVYVSRLAQSSMSLMLNLNLKPGMYFVSMKNDKGNYFNKSIIIN